MGKTNKKLSIAVDLIWENHPKVKELAEKGHLIVTIQEHSNGEGSCVAMDVDLILSKKASYWNDDMWDYLEIALKRAREGRYGKANAGNEASAGDDPGPKPAARKRVRADNGPAS